MSAHTPGPWQWTVSPRYRSVELCRGQYGDVVLGFCRWGMAGATPMFRKNGIMRRAVDLSVPQPGREHHADWWRIIEHPDASLIAAAPELLAALEAFVERHISMCHAPTADGLTFGCVCDPRVQDARVAIAKAKGLL